MPDRARSLFVALVAVLALVGCSGIPTTGNVTEGQSLTETDSGDFDFFPLGPAADATQEEILRGFVAAFTGSANDYAKAREFLTSKFAESWNPRKSVTVRSSIERYTPTSADGMDYTIDATATLDAAGSYRQNDQPETLTSPIQFAQEDGEWRISQAPDGIVLPEGLFHSIFDQQVLYFLDPTNSFLVPDIRFFLNGTATLRVVSALLDGPPDWLQGAVRTAFPDGTNLVSPNVEVLTGTAIVDLSTEALSAGAADRRLMQLQLNASLISVASIRRVSITVSGAPLAVGAVTGADPEVRPLVDSRPIVLQDGAFGYLSTTAVTGMAQLGPRVVAVEPTGATVGAGANSAAVLGSEGAFLVRTGDAGTLLLDTRQDLVTPSLDGEGYVWVASSSSPDVISIYDAEGGHTDLPTGLPADARLASVDVSRDGTRVAILLATQTGPRLAVKGIVRDPNRRLAPTSFTESAVDSAFLAGEAIDATWIDPTSVATLSSRDGVTVVTKFEVGGEREDLGHPGAALSIVGANGESDLRVLSSTGTIVKRSGNSWTDQGLSVSLLATQR